MAAANLSNRLKWTGACALILSISSLNSRSVRAQQPQANEQRLRAEIATARLSHRAAHDAYVAALKSRDMTAHAAAKARFDAERMRHQQLQAQLAALRAQNRARHAAQIAAEHAATVARHEAERAKEQADHAKHTSSQANFAKLRAGRHQAKGSSAPKG